MKEKAAGGTAARPKLFFVVESDKQAFSPRGKFLLSLRPSSSSSLSSMLASTSAPAHLQQQRCSLTRPSHISRQQHQQRTRSPRSLRVLADKFCRDVVSTPREKPVDDGSESSVTFVGAGGKEITIQCKKSEYILDAGLEAGLELPYTCRAGICGACVGKVVAGEVDQSDVSLFDLVSVCCWGSVGGVDEINNLCSRFLPSFSLLSVSKNDALATDR